MDPYGQFKTFKFGDKNFLNMRIPFDPIQRSKEIERLVMTGKKRKYYRFRRARFYGGIVTADTVGCNLLCAYCWNYKKNLNPGSSPGFFHSPDEVSKRLIEILTDSRLRRVRISGAEPILGEDSFFHILEVMDFISSSIEDFEFILETNGIILGTDSNLSKSLSGIKNLYVRVSMKGYNEESFEKITGARGEFFWLQVRALRNLMDSGCFFWPAVMYEIFGEDGIGILKGVLESVGYEGEIELEYLYRYPFVDRNLKKRGIVDIFS